MGLESQDPLPPPGNLSPGQVRTFQRMEPKTLGAVQIVIGCLLLCLSASVLQLHEVYFTADVMVFLVVVVQSILSGSVLIHSGRRPSLCWVKCTLVLHFVSAAFSTAALGLMSKHLPYRTDSYHCQHCRGLQRHAAQFCFRRCTELVEKQCTLMVDGILWTLVIFLVLELLLCITVMLFGLSVLASGGGGTTTPVGGRGPAYPQTRPPAAAPPAAAQLLQPAAAVVTEPQPDPGDDEPTPPTEPQVEPIEVDVVVRQA